MNSKHQRYLEIKVFNSSKGYQTFGTFLIGVHSHRSLTFPDDWGRSECSTNRCLRLLVLQFVSGDWAPDLLRMLQLRSRRHHGIWCFPFDSIVPESLDVYATCQTKCWCVSVWRDDASWILMIYPADVRCELRTSTLNLQLQRADLRLNAQMCWKSWSLNNYRLSDPSCWFCCLIVFRFSVGADIQRLRFAAAETNVLVCTDIAQRGIDLPNCQCGHLGDEQWGHHVPRSQRCLLLCWRVLLFQAFVSADLRDREISEERTESPWFLMSCIHIWSYMIIYVSIFIFFIRYSRLLLVTSRLRVG